MRKGLLEYCILSIINRDEAYASDILDTLKEARLVVVEGTVYPLLTRMKNEGLLSYRWQESTGGPPRKYTPSPKRESNCLLNSMKNGNPSAKLLTK